MIETKMVETNIKCRDCNDNLHCDIDSTIDGDPRAARLILCCVNSECLLELDVQHDKDVYFEAFQEVR